MSNSDNGNGGEISIGPERAQYRALGHRVYVHGDLLERDAFEGQANLARRFSLVLHHLAANGKTSVVKGCKGASNQGWLRSPLGGSNGMQYYLWWTSQGLPPTDGMDLPKDAVAVRAVRHHDDHDTLVAGNADDYHEFTQEEIRSDDLVEQPWTDEQVQFIHATDAVRIVTGRPGTGKTSVLWEAVHAGLGSRVLYLTWSDSLVSRAGQEFAAFAPEGVTVEVHSIFEFMGEVLRKDVRMKRLADSRREFYNGVSHLHNTVLGVWTNRIDALHDEVRAYLLGRAVPGQPDCVEAGSVYRLTEQAYRELRGAGSSSDAEPRKESGIGNRGARELAPILKAMKFEEVCARAFPDLLAAAATVNKIKRGKLRDDLVCWDAIVIDECQDLTLLELAIPLEVARQSRQRRQIAPTVLLAGDEAQTVRPTGFHWGRYKDFVALQLTAPSDFHLNSNLRSPDRIARVIERVSTLHEHLEKAARPTQQQHNPGGEHVMAQLLHVATDDTKKAVAAIQQLDRADVAILTTGNALPDWLPASALDHVLSPADAKGLEFQAVCILDPGRTLVELDQPIGAGPAAAIEQSHRRTAIDQLRVALSRATETLVFLDVEPTDEQREASWRLLGDAAPYDIDDLPAYFQSAETSVVERVTRRVHESRELIEQRPRAAWQRAMQAVTLLGNRDVPDGVSDAAVRQDALRNLAATAARLMAGDLPADLSRDTVMAAGQVAFEELGLGEGATTLALLADWLDAPEGSPVELLESLLESNDAAQLIMPAIRGVAQNLLTALEAGAQSPDTAAGYAGDLESWLAATGAILDAPAKARELRVAAFDTLLAARRPEPAHLVLQRIEPADHAREALYLEGLGEYEKAAHAFEKLKLKDDALRCWRSAANWEKALKLAGDEAAADLQWLADLSALVYKRPRGISERMAPADWDRLEKVVANIGKRPQGRGGKR